MTILLAAIGYFLLCLFVGSVQQAALMAVLAGLSLFVVTRLCRAGPIEAFQWFRQYRLRGLFVIALTCAVLIAGIAYQTIFQALVQAPLAFVWFWMFAAVPTYSVDRAASKP